MADNLLSNINSIVNSSFLEHVRLEPKYQNATVQSPPVPSFLFFDRFGLFGVAETQFTFLTSIIALFGVIGVTFILRIACSSKFKIYQHFIRPSLNSFLSVIFAFVITMCISFIFAIVKQFVNPDTVYGHPELSAISTVFFVLASLCLSEIVWQHVSIALKLSDRPIFFDSIYETLSASEPLDFSTDSDDEHVVRNSDNANSEDIHDEGFSDERYSQANTQSNLGDYAPDFNLHPELMPLIVNTQGSALSPVPRIREKSQVLCAWFPVGILMFWTCSLIAALIFSMEGFSILYLTYDLALFSTANLLLTFFLEYYYLKLLHQDLFVAQTIFQERFVLFYEKYFWICQVLFCTAVPFLFVADVLHTAIVSLPSLIGEGLPSTVIDLSFTFLILIALIGTMPVLSQTDRSKTLAIFGTIAICLWIVQALLFSYSPDRPFKYRFHEIWDLDTNLTTSKVYLMPGMNGDQWIKQMKLPDTLLLGSDMLHWAGSVGEINSTFKNPKIPVFMSPRISKQSRQYIKGHLKGITESRACKLEILGSVTNFTILPSLLWLGASPQANPVTVLKRAYDTSDNEILIDFEIELMELISTPPAIRASCFLPLGNHSIVYNQFLSAKPDWTLCDGEGELGGLEVRRVFHLS